MDQFKYYKKCTYTKLILALRKLQFITYECLNIHYTFYLCIKNLLFKNNQTPILMGLPIY